MMERTTSAAALGTSPRWNPLTPAHQERVPDPIPEKPSPVGTRSAAVVSRQSAVHAALTEGLDRLSHGVALLDADGNIRYANAAARSLFRRLGQSQSSTGPTTTPSSWAPSLREVCLSGRRQFLRVRVNDAQTVVVLIPLSTPGNELAFAVFGRDELCGAVELQMFALQFQLTSAETMVLRQLTRGLNAGAIALEHRVARTTVLTQIAAIRAKTCCNSVRSLLETLARMPPIRAVQPVRDGL